MIPEGMKSLFGENIWGGMGGGEVGCVIMSTFLSLHLIRNSFIIMNLVLLMGVRVNLFVNLFFLIQIMKLVPLFLRLHTSFVLRRVLFIG